MVDPTKLSSSPVRTLAPAPASTGAKTQSGSAKPTAKPNAKPAVRKATNYSTTPFWMGMSLSIVWVAIVAFAMTQAGGAHSFAGLELSSWAIGISAIVSPVAMIWMIAAYLQRAADVQSVTEPLRRQLAMITGESGAAELRIRRFNHAIKEQLELLRSTKNIGDNELMEIIERINAHKADLEQFEQNSIYQVKEIQDVIRRSMQHIDQLMEDKFTMLRVLDSKLVQSGEDVARQTDGVRNQIAGLLEEIQGHASLVASSIEQAMSDSRKLSDTARAQETSLLSAAETASSTLQELSGKIDTNIAHFLGRTGLAREEAERLASALDTQTRSLDEFSSLLPARLNEAEAVLRGVADRLYASEQLAREQATNLSERLEAQIEGMQTLLDRFGARVHEIDGQLGQRGSDLDGLVVRISGASVDLASQLDSTIASLAARADGSLKQFKAANDEARRGTDAIASHLAETAGKYEAATRHLGAMTEENAVQLRAISSEINKQLAQFETLHQASQQAGQEVQTQAAMALTNLQQVLERLLATRDATQSVGETLTEKLRLSVEHNERVITRINEAARMSVHALGIATESLGRQEKDITAQTQTAESTLRATIAELQEQAQAAEDAMRSQNENFNGMILDIRERLDSTDKRLQDFADYAAAPVQQVVDQIDASTAQGRESLSRYGNDMQGQLERLQQFNSRVGDMGRDVGRMTSETLAAIEDLNKRFAAIRAAQDETSKTAIEQFNGMADRLQREVTTIGSRAMEAATTLQQAASQVGQQTKQLQNEAEGSGDKIQAITAALQNEAAALRSSLEKQAGEINAELTRAGSHFAELGATLKERTDAAYALLDRVAAHYNEITRAATEDLEARANKLGETADTATGKVGTLSGSMERQLELINSSAHQIEANAESISSASLRTLDRLGQLDAQFAVTQKSAVDGTDRVADRLAQAVQNFKEQHARIDEASESAVSFIQKAGGAFGEQASRMLDTTHQVEESIRSLNSATTTFAQQTSEIRSAMEQHNGTLITNLKDSVSDLDTLSEQLQKAVAQAVSGADKADARYRELTDSAKERLDGTTQDLYKAADRTEGMLSQLSADVTRQVGALNMVGEQIAEQHRILTKTNETQREQLLDLFNKLGAAHNEASSVAERTITRLDDTLHKVQDFLGLLSDQSQTALANVTSAGIGFAEQAMGLINHAQKAEEQARTAMNVTASLQEQAKQLHTALHDETKRAGDMLGDLMGRLTSGSGEMRDISTSANTALSELQMGMARQASSLNETMEQIAARQRELSAALEAQRETLGGLVARLGAAQDETAEASARSASRMAESAAQIEAQIEKIDTRASAALSSVKEAGEGFTRESATLSASAEAAENRTKQLLESASDMRKQAEKVCDELSMAAQAAGNALGDVVGKIEGNVSSLRETTVAAESSLRNLDSSISQQTTAIDGNLQTISDKQTALASALDIQREMLSGMVTRLTLAQDEAAAAAERSAARMNDSTAQIAKQMETIGAQTQEALAAIRAASTGLSDEQTALAEHTKQAEAQIKNMLEATSGMHGETRQIRESMQKEATQVIEQIRTVMAQLDATVLQLKEKSGNVVGTMDQSAMDFSAVAKKASETLQRHAEELASVARTAESNLGTVGERIREDVKLITDASSLTQEHGQALTVTAEKATSQLVQLIGTMADSDRDTRATLEKATTHLTETRVTLERELRTIADLSQKAVEQVMGAGSALAIQSDALRANLASSESALTGAADMVRAETTQLPALLGRTKQEIETATKSFKEQTAEISDTMLKTTDRCISATGAIRDTMMDEARQMVSVADMADQTLNAFNDALKAQVTAIRTGTATLSEEQKEMVEKASQTITQLSAASDRLAQLRTDTQQTTAKLAQEFEKIETRATSTTHRLASAGDNLFQQIEALAAMTEKTEGKMMGASQTFREQLERIRGGVQSQIDEINRGLMQITAQLDRTGTSLRSAMAGTVVDVEKIANRFEQTSKETSGQLADRTARMRVATEEVSKLLGGFGDQIDVLLDRLNMAGDGIKRHEGDLVGHLQQAFSHLGSVAERLDSTRVLASNVAEAAVAKLSEVGQTVEKQVRGAAEGGQKVSSIIQTVAQTYADQAGRVNGTVIEAQDQIIAMGKAVEEMQQRTDRMRVTLKLQGDDLLDSLEQILRKLGSAGDAMSDAVDVSLQQQAINSLKKVN